MTDTPNTPQTIDVGDYDVTIRLQHNDLIYVSAPSETVAHLVQQAAQKRYGDNVGGVEGMSNPGWHFTVATGHKEQKEKNDTSLPVITVDDLAKLAGEVNEQYPDRQSVVVARAELHKRKTATEEQNRRTEAEKITGKISAAAERNGSPLNDAAKAEITDLLVTELGRKATASRAR